MTTATEGDAAVSIPENHPAVLQAIEKGMVVEHAKPAKLRGLSLEFVPVPLPVGYVLTIRMAVKVKSEMNRRDHWAVRSRRFNEQATEFLTATRWLGEARPPLPCIVTFTHRGSRMDDDNLASAFKGLRDAIAIWLGLDDADPRVTWEYRQKLERRPVLRGVDVMFENREETT